MSPRNQQRDSALLECIQSYTIEHGYSPTIREISKALGLYSTGSIYSRLMRLRNEGQLTWEENRARTIRVTVPEGTAKE